MVVLLPLDALDCVNPERIDISEGLDNLVRLSARRCCELCLCRTRERLRELSSVYRRRRRGSSIELAEEPRRLTVLLSGASGIWPRLGVYPLVSSSQYASCSSLCGANDTISSRASLFGAFFNVRRTDLDFLLLPLSDPAHDEDADRGESSALLLRDVRYRVRGWRPSRGAWSVYRLTGINQHPTLQSSGEY
jgi:hypothetical protein